MIWRFTASVAIVVAGATSPSAQSRPSLQELLDRLGAYLAEYETHLSTVVADEHFEQNVYARGLSREFVTLDSEVAFMRLPGDGEWLGFREVRKKNWKPIASSGPSMAELLASSAANLTKAVSMARASARHNLGLPRTINTPTTPLDIIHPRHRGAHRFELRGTERVRRQRVVVIGFEEIARPTLLREPSGVNLVSNGRIWADPATGAVWRVEWIYRRERSSSRPPSLRVEFQPHAALQLMVPYEMRERFHGQQGMGEGRATYRNFRRFATGARIVPQ
jgi:hypothetical protein